VVLFEEEAMLLLQILHLLLCSTFFLKLFLVGLLFTPQVRTLSNRFLEECSHETNNVKALILHTASVGQA